MHLTAVSAPEGLPVKTEDAKAHLRVEAMDDDTLIEGLIKAATQHLDGRDGTLGRALVEQQWDLTLDRFPWSTHRNRHRRIKIPLPPLRSIDQVTYVDQDGNTQTLASTDYQTVLGGDWGGYIEPAIDKTWPSTRDVPEAATIRFTAGYPPDSASPPDPGGNVPEPIKLAIKLIVGHYYENRELSISGTIISEIPMAASALVGPYRASWL